MWLPHWAMALLLVLPIMAVETFQLLQLLWWLPWTVALYTMNILAQVAFVIPGALKRLNWRHILVMLGIGAVLWAQAWFFPWRDLPIPYHDAFLLAIAMAMIAVGLGEWALATNRSLWALALVVLASVAVACDLMLVLVQDTVVLPRTISGYEEYRRRVPFLIPKRLPKSADFIVAGG